VESYYFYNYHWCPIGFWKEPSGTPEQESQCGTAGLQSSGKFLEHKREANKGLSKSFLCSFTALIHGQRILSFLENACKLCPISPTILQAAQHQGIAKTYLTIDYL